MTENEEELKSLLMRVEEETEKKNWLKSGHSKYEYYDIQAHHL